MITAGIDIGSITAKAAVLEEGRILGTKVMFTGYNSRQAGQAVLGELIAEIGIAREKINAIIATGYGRNSVDFADKAITEITCHAAGAHFIDPLVRFIIDIGGQDCKTMKLDKDGNVGRFSANDKCASGTGRFLEVMAKVLGIDIEELGKLSGKAKMPITLASTCTVWAQADVIKYINSGVSVEDIGAGINTAMAQRVAILVNTVKPEGDILMTGGVAKNIGVVTTLEKLIGRRIKLARKADPQIAGAIGAALISMEKINGKGRMTR